MEPTGGAAQTLLSSNKKTRVVDRARSIHENNQSEQRSNMQVSDVDNTDDPESTNGLFDQGNPQSASMDEEESKASTAIHSLSNKDLNLVPTSLIDSANANQLAANVGGSAQKFPASQLSGSSTVGSQQQVTNNNTASSFALSTMSKLQQKKQFPHSGGTAYSNSVAKDRHRSGGGVGGLSKTKPYDDSSGSNISEDDEVPQKQHNHNRTSHNSFLFPSNSETNDDNQRNMPSNGNLSRGKDSLDHCNSLHSSNLRDEIDSTMYRQDPKYFIPPPENLIAKSVFIQEPIRSGAPFSFVKCDILQGGFERKEELMGFAKERGAIQGGSLDQQQQQQQQQQLQSYKEAYDPNSTYKPFTKYIVDELVKANNESRLVYCRFGKQYVQNLERQMNSLLYATTQVATSAKTATYLINIKKLIKDHNIESDNVVQMRTNANISKQNDAPPLPFYYPESDQDQTLVFESRFESGNLLASIKVSDNEYDMFLQNDINTNGHTQWYFFRASNTKKDLKVKFNFHNLSKSDSLYNDGMRILAFSIKTKKDRNLGWHRSGSDISYFQNTYKKENLRFTRYYYTFTFTYQFEHDQDQVYFAHCFPYTYSDLQDDLTRIEKDPYTSNFFYRTTLCRTLAGNKCDYLTITSKDKDPTSEKAMSKKGIFISARVHPGESNASWMMKGLIDFLVSNAPEARALREKFVFKIVPMINVDGVINGNYRCSLCGSDLNRRYKTPSKVIQPVVYSIKRLVKAFSKERELLLFCDLHGHSRRKNIFMYGNSGSTPQEQTESRLFPFILSKLCDFFNFEQCRFSMHKSKEATARIAMYKELKIPTIYTLEASFSGADRGALKDHHFTTEHLMTMGRKVLEALIVFSKINVIQTLAEIRTRKGTVAAIEEEEKGVQIEMDQGYKSLSYEAIHKELSENKQLIKMTEGGKDGDGGSSGSESDPSEDNLEEEEIAKIVPIKPGKKKLPDKKKPLIDLKAKKKDEPPPSNKKDPKAQPKLQQKSPVKKIFNYSNPLYDRLKLRQIKKIEMVDAWTQTSDRSNKGGRNNSSSITGNAAGANTSANNNAGAQANPTVQVPPGCSGQQNPPIESALMSPNKDENKRRPPNLISSDIKEFNETQLIKDIAAGSRPVGMQDSGSSPQPQIRIRKDPLKQNNAPQFNTSLAQIEERNAILQNQLGHVQPNLMMSESPRASTNLNRTMNPSQKQQNGLYNSSILNHNRQISGKEGLQQQQLSAQKEVNQRITNLTVQHLPIDSDQQPASNSFMNNVGGGPQNSSNLKNDHPQEGLSNQRYKPNATTVMPSNSTFTPGDNNNTKSSFSGPSSVGKLNNMPNPNNSNNQQNMRPSLYSVSQLNDAKHQQNMSNQSKMLMLQQQRFAEFQETLSANNRLKSSGPKRDSFSNHQQQLQLSQGGSFIGSNISSNGGMPSSQSQVNHNSSALINVGAMGVQQRGKSQFHGGANNLNAQQQMLRNMAAPIAGSQPKHLDSGIKTGATDRNQYGLMQTAISSGVNGGSGQAASQGTRGNLYYSQTDKNIRSNGGGSQPQGGPIGMQQQQIPQQQQQQILQQHIQISNMKMPPQGGIGAGVNQNRNPPQQQQFFDKTSDRR